MTKKQSSLRIQQQAVAEFQHASNLLKEVRKLMQHGNPALRPYIKALVAGYENWIADPHTPISKVPAKIKFNPDGSHTVECSDARITPHGFIWMAQIWLNSTNEWILAQNRQKKREKKARERLAVLRQAKKSLSPDLYTVAHAYHNFVTGRKPSGSPRSMDELVLNAEEFLAETDKLILEVSRIEGKQEGKAIVNCHELGNAA